MPIDHPSDPTIEGHWHAFVCNRLAWVMLYIGGGAGVAAFGIGPEAILLGLHAYIVVAGIGVFRFRERWLTAHLDALQHRLRDARTMLVETGERSLSVGARAYLEESLRAAHDRAVLLESQRDDALRLASEVAEAAFESLTTESDSRRFASWRQTIETLRRQAASTVQPSEPDGAGKSSESSGSDATGESDSPDDADADVPMTPPRDGDHGSQPIVATPFGFPRIAAMTSWPVFPQPLSITPADIPERPGDQRRTRRLSQEMLACNLGDVMDLSLGGMRVRTPRHGAPDEGREVEVRFDAAEPPLTLRGVVVRSTPLGARRTELGVRFIDVSPEAHRQITRLSMAHRKRLTFAAA